MSDQLSILLVTTDEADYHAIRDIFSDISGLPFAIDWVSTLKEAERIIELGDHDAYLINYRIGRKSGLELLGKFDLVQRPEPFIILGSTRDETMERRAMRAGAADFLVKSTLDSELLSRALRYSLQRKLIEAQRVHQLMEINRSKDEFIALASHQLRTPATAVKQYIGMILEGYAGDITAEQRRFLQSAYESNERQIRVVNDILRVAKLDLKKITLKRTPIDIGLLVINMLHDMASLFQGREQQLHISVPRKSLISEIDVEYMRMALGNIIDNASKYTPSGKAISVRVALQKDVLKHRDMVVITIKDEGVGIAQVDKDKLFKKFSRIDNPLSLKVGGTGLGLYWSNEVIQMHGGSIKVDSKPGRGTAFKIYLSRATSSAPRATNHP